MNKFLRGKIYKITSPTNPDLIYIGSTCSELHRRFNEHKNSYKNYVKTGKKYISCFIIRIFIIFYLLFSHVFHLQNQYQCKWIQFLMLIPRK